MRYGLLSLFRFLSDGNVAQDAIQNDDSNPKDNAVPTEHCLPEGLMVNDHSEHQSVDQPSDHAAYTPAAAIA